MKIFIASDHAGVELKSFLKEKLKNFEVVDLGPENKERVDYPDYAKKVAKSVQKEGIGILICGTGIGMSISANKFKGIRAALANDIFLAKLAKEHNNANILCLGARVVAKDLAYEIVKTWLETKFEGGRHTQRIEKIEKTDE